METRKEALERQVLEAQLAREQAQLAREQAHLAREQAQLATEQAKLEREKAAAEQAKTLHAEALKAAQTQQQLAERQLAQGHTRAVQAHQSVILQSVPPFEEDALGLHTWTSHVDATIKEHPEHKTATYRCLRNRLSGQRSIDAWETCATKDEPWEELKKLLESTLSVQTELTKLTDQITNKSRYKTVAPENFGAAVRHDRLCLGTTVTDDSFINALREALPIGAAKDLSKPVPANLEVWIENLNRKMTDEQGLTNAWDWWSKPIASSSKTSATLARADSRKPEAAKSVSGRNTSLARTDADDTPRHIAVTFGQRSRSNFRLIIDTASNRNVVSKSFCLKYNVTIKPIEHPTNITGAFTNVCGVAVFTFKMGRKRYKVRADVVPDDWVDVLVGWPWLGYHNAVVHCGRKIIEIGGQRLDAVRTDGEIKGAVTAMTAQSVQQKWELNRSREYDRAKASFSLPSTENIKSRVQMAAGSTSADRRRIEEMLTSRSLLVREYLPNSPPPIPVTPVKLIWEEGATPPHARNIRLSPTVRQVIEEQTRNFLDSGIVERAVGGGNLALFGVQEPTKVRAVLDGRAANDMLKNVRHAPPHIAEVYDFLADAKRICSIDAAGFFHQIPLDHNDRPFFAFSAGALGRVQMTRLPQGCAQSPAFATALLEHILRDMRHMVIVYVDNMVIKQTGSDDEFFRDLSKILDLLNEWEVTLNLRSSYWCGDADIPVLGAMWSRGQLCISKSSKETILEIPTPTKIEEVRRALGMVQYLSAFIPNCALLLAPFQKLVSASKAIKPSAELDDQWRTVKRAVANAFTIHAHQPGEQLIVRSDASLTGWGAALAVVRGQTEYPLAFVSRTWKGAEPKLSAVLREAYGLLRAVEALQPLIQGEPHVTFETDSSAVAAILHHEGNDRLAKIGSELSFLGVKENNLRHVKGSDNAVADFASRLVLTTLELPMPRGGTTYAGEGMITREQQEADPFCKAELERCEQLRKGSLDGTTSSALLHGTIQRFRIHQNLLHRIDFPTAEDPDGDARLLVVVPTSEVQRILGYVHGALTAHARKGRLVASVRERYWWEGLSKATVAYANACLDCQRASSVAQVRPSTGDREAAGVGAVVYLDIGYIGPKDAPDKVFLVAVDQASGFIRASALANQTGQEVVRAFREIWIDAYGTPVAAVADNGPAFRSAQLQTLAERFGFELRHSSPYNPQGNVAETAVKKVKTGLARCLNDERFQPLITRGGWPELLRTAVVPALNGTRSDAVGAAPAALFMGRNIRTPSDGERPQDTRLHIPHPEESLPIAQEQGLFRDSNAELREAQQRRRFTFFDREKQIIRYAVGTRVMRAVHNPGPLGKMAWKTEGPFIVQGAVGDSNYRLLHTDGTPVEGNVHSRWLRQIMD